MKITVIGEPAPQGSKKYVGHSAAGHAIMIESSKKARPWREAVKMTAYEQRNGGPPFDGPLYVQMVFTVLRPKSAPKRRHYPDGKPDLSKLVRSTEDALTDAGVIVSDARIVRLVAVKVFPTDGSDLWSDPDALDVPGVVITIERNV